MAIVSTLTVQAAVRESDGDAMRTILPRATLSRSCPAECASAVLRLQFDYVDMLANSPSGTNKIDDALLAAELDGAAATDARIAVRAYSGGIYFVLDVKRGQITRLGTIGGYGTNGGTFNQDAKRCVLLSGGPVVLRWSAASVP